MAAENLKQKFSELIELLRNQKWEESGRIISSNEEILHYVDNCKRYAAHWAASCGYLPLIQRCVTVDESITERTDDCGWTLLMIASSAGHSDCVRYLLGIARTDVNHKNFNGQTSLHYACSKNHLAIARMLVENGAELNVQDNNGATPLHRAASQGHENVVIFLVGRDHLHLDVSDDEGNTPLHLACEENHGSIAIFLVRSGANLNKENKEEKTPLALVVDAELKRKLCQAFDLRK